MMIRAMEEYSQGSIIFKTAGMDPDRLNLFSFFTYRDVARNCIDYNAYAITNDSDFFIYQIPGVIDLNALLSAYQHESRL